MGGDDEDPRGELVQLAREAWTRRARWQSRPETFTDDEAVAALLTRLRADGLPPPELAALAEYARDECDTGPDAVLAAACLTLLSGVDADGELCPLALSLMALRPFGTLVRPLARQALRMLERARPPLLTELVARAPLALATDAQLGPELRALVGRLLDAGDLLEPSRVPTSPWEDESSALPLLRALADQDRRDARFQRLYLQVVAGDFARVLGAHVPSPPGLIEFPALRAAAEDVVAAVAAEPPGAILVIGPPGSGRSTLMGLVAALLAERGDVLIEARPEEIVAGQIYVNQLDGRLRDLAAAAKGRRVVWIAPGFDSGLIAGRASGDPRCLGEYVAPHLAAGALGFLGELGEEAQAALGRESPQLARVVRIARVPIAPDPDLLRIARAALERAAAGTGVEVRAEEAVIDGALALARHLLPHRALPGGLVDLLEASLRVAARRTEAPVVIDSAAVFGGLTALTGMPRDVLDEALPLDLDETAAWLRARVLGQPEAVEALVDRIALIKSGLADPERPYGTLLFAGPTGTGKTEIARALAEYLFGSAERMVRIGMSELKTPESLDRLLGTGGAQGAESLVARVRAQPFSVVLLDEFEKAHKEVWDLFLQVLDAGRLSDQDGRTVDFRQTIVILTSNIGSAIGPREGFGFGPDGGGGFAPERVHRALRHDLRPELLNRFDRIVVFRPLSRDVMRSIVRKEVAAALSRRGLAQREWAVEVDESAIELLLERGFTHDLGARPLKRAVESHLLVPLARAIAQHDAPRGEQFLLVSAGGDSLEVAFVAADDSSGPAPAETPRIVASAEEVAREAVGTRAELHAIRARLEMVRAVVAEAEWASEKDAALAALGREGFWDEPERYAVLGRAEVMDRIEHGLRAAASLLQRLFSLAPDDGARIAPERVARLAREVVQLDRGVGAIIDAASQRAVLAVQSAEGGEELVALLEDMYRGWAREVGAALHVGHDPARPGHRVLVVDGLGAFPSLLPEAGLHILERGGSRRSRRLAAARVVVAPWPDGEPEPSALGRLAATKPDVSVARRYQREPTPLVRDRIRGYRTGRLDRVLSGGFDLF